MIALIDYGAGNLRSVHNALNAAGATNVTVTADPEVVAKADRIVLPGVGAFRACIEPLRAISGMETAMREAVFTHGRPFLGICVGMQLLADAGEEFGRHEGLGWIGGTVRRIEPTDDTIKVPHMGWNDVVPARAHALVEPGEAYFLHSYYFEAADAGNVVATTHHGAALTAAVGRDNMLGVQFHPEKSQAYGLATLARFLAWKP